MMICMSVTRYTIITGGGGICPPLLLPPSLNANWGINVTSIITQRVSITGFHGIGIPRMYREELFPMEYLDSIEELTELVSMAMEDLERGVNKTGFLEGLVSKAMEDLV